ncbi:hypothetical protein ACHAXM_010790 [Skeletonema potamos]
MESQQTKSISQEEYEALLLAASKTAGSETWKTCAGRSTGPDNFVLSDAWRCMKISLRKHVRRKNESLVCPVCMDVPSDDADDGWYCTKSCHHSVCKQCLRSYSQSLLSDPSHSGPLKCPCCPRLLREDDAIVALSFPKNNDVTSAKKKKLIFPSKHEMKYNQDDESSRVAAVELLEKWQTKALIELLRKMDDYRPCPHCQKHKNTFDTMTSNSSGDSSALHISGGGFVTGDCLRLVNDERESNAQVIVRLAETGTVKIVLLAFTLYYMYCCGSSVQGSELRQVVMAILPALGLPAYPYLINLMLVRIARKQIMRPINVTCPCCEKEFNLPSSEIEIVKSSTDESQSEMATQQWKNVHTRKCPTCFTPIEKNGGCNHVRCGRCRTEFCWACMRAKTRCRAYNCENDAPYGGNASATSGSQAQLEHFTLMERIDRLEFDALERLRLFPRPEQCIPMFCWLLFASGLDSLLGITVWWLLCTLASLLFRLSSVVCVFVLCWATSNHCRNWLRRRVVAEVRTFRTEAEMVAEAVRRSMREY